MRLADHYAPEATQDDPNAWQCALEAEQSVLGALLISNDAVDTVGDLLEDGDFYVGNHRAIFRAIVRIIGRGQLADVLTVADELRTQDPLAFSGVMGYLGEMTMAMPSALNVRRYAEIVADRAQRRRLARAAHVISESLTERPMLPVVELKERAEQVVLAAVEDRASASAFVQVGQVLPAVMEEIDSRYNAADPNALIGIPSGFTDLDLLTLGMQPGQLIIVGARPAMGKSSFALNVAENAARSSKRMALFFSLEMGIRQLAFRTLAGGAGINVQRLYTGRLNDSEWARLATAMGKVVDMPIAFCERGDVRMADVRSLARRAKREFRGLSVIVLDYLQLMLGADSEANRAAQLSEITRGLKLMAKELEVPVIALSQLNRELEKRGNKRPIVADLRDSGSIEQDADNIYFIYRDEVYNPHSDDRGIAEIIVAKQRDGPTGTIRLKFRADATRFSDYVVGQVREAA